jgi:hypothetical protein
MGWNGVGVGEAFGATVTSTTVGGTGAEGAIPQEERMMAIRAIKRQKCFVIDVCMSLRATRGSEAISS